MEPERPKPVNKNYPPIFVICQCFIIVVLWLTSAIRGDLSANIAEQPAGLEELTKGSLVSGVTTFVLYRDCVDLRHQAWRWISYQFSHNSLIHMFGSLILMIFFGSPVEAYHGGTLLFLYLNVGVLAGACGQGLLNGHEDLAGLSAGCFALFGMHIADLIVNFRYTRFRWGKLFVLLLALTLDVGIAVLMLGLDRPYLGTRLARSLADRVGGLFAGLLLGLLCGRTLLRKCFSRVLKAFALFLLLGFFAFGIAWISQWPPRTLLYPEPWCWSRKAYNSSVSVATAAGAAAPAPVQAQCVRCSDQSCIDFWSQRERVALHEALHCSDEDWADSPL